jgi:hypothetical protein
MGTADAKNPDMEFVPHAGWWIAFSMGIARVAEGYPPDTLLINGDENRHLIAGQSNVRNLVASCHRQPARRERLLRSLSRRKLPVRNRQKVASQRMMSGYQAASILNVFE